MADQPLNALRLSALRLNVLRLNVLRLNALRLNALRLNALRLSALRLNVLRLNVLRSAEINVLVSPHEERFELWRARSQDVLESQESLRQDWSQR